MSDQVSEPPPLTKKEMLPPFVARTPLGRRLWEIRGQILASGTQPLSWDQIEREVSEERRDRTMG